MTPASSPSRALHLVRRRWPWVVATPLATVLLAGAFLFLVTPRFEGSTTLRLVEDEAALGGALTGAAQSATGGLSVLASLTGRGVPLQTEMAVLGSRGLAE
ncbi:MAG: Wzz/FepE/Etk N-terminal domain-containing protein, partial [Longimicrobiales bacterium]|nr:Wzz/FepE/Etk N-terminal domain-containing protein [Longimicrobiales bacterium]